ncbi:MAG: hypothetical protein JXM70_02710 [Pirellulales bacterium]|nr:hypothetical protein [Pirellulales bacterium]
MKYHIFSILIVAFFVLSTGCSSLKWPMSTPVEDVVELRKQRKSEVMAEFDQRRDWAEFHAAKTAWIRGDTMRCRQSLTRLLNRNPHHAEARALLAKMDQEDEKPLESTTPVQLASFDSSRQTPFPSENVDQTTNNPSCSGSVKLAERAEANGSTDLALSAQLLAEGEKALAGGDCESAMEFFNQAQAAIPNDPQIPTLAAVSALELNRADVAVSLTKPAIVRFPGSAALHRTMGVACYRCGDYESSQVVLQQALSLDNTNALTYFLQGCALSKLGESEAAQTHLRQAATLDPRYAQCRVSD